jgi:LysM repeat protein
LDLNNLTSNTIRVGQKLKIGTVPAPSPSVTGGANYNVVAGDTISVIAERYGLTSEELKQINNLSSNNLRIGQVLRVPATSSATTGTTAMASSGEYKVQKGDTVSGVAHRLGITEDNLRKLNKLSGDTITVGQTLKVAAGGTAEREYVVATGDTVSVIAERFGMKTSQLKEINNLSSDNIRVGQKLKVMARGQATQVAQSAPAQAQATTERSTSSATAPRANDEVYVVQGGDTVSQIAERFGVRSDELRKSNNLTSDNIRTGQRLIITASARPQQAQQQIQPARQAQPAQQQIQPAQESQQPAPARQAQATQRASSAGGVTETYVVQNGDTVSQIAERFGMRSSDLRETNNLSGDNIRIGQRLYVVKPAQGSSPRPAAQAQARPGQGVASADGADSYVVQSGDTVSQIAQRFGVKPADLRQLNNLSGDNIRIGQRLRLKGSLAQASARQVPSGVAASGSYKVVPGDTMYSIANKHKLTVDRLKSLNNKQNDIVRPGEILKVQ